MTALGWRRPPLVRVGLAAAVAVALLTATASLSAHSASKGLPTLRLDYYAIAPVLAASLDPAIGGAPGDPATVALVQANLVHILPNGQVAPDLAAYKVSKNRLVYTFTIRSNARFSNGHPVTAQDAAFSLQRALASSTNSPSALTSLGLIRGAQAFHRGKAKGLTGVKVLGRLTLQITITQPAGYFLDALSLPTGDVLDPAVVAGKPIDVWMTNTCAGNQGAGPLEFVCHDRSSSDRSFYTGHVPTYTLVPNPYYYGRKPHLRLELPAFGDITSTYKRYLAGKLDALGTYSVPFAYLRQWQGKKEFHEFPSSQMAFLVPNTHLAPFDNVHCRLAVAYAVDRNTLVNTVLLGANLPAYTVVPKGMLGYYPGTDNPHFNLKRARAELAKCPVRTTPVGLKFPGGVWGIKAMPFVDRELKAIGMNVRLVPLSPDQYTATDGQPLDKTGTQLLLGVFVQDYPDPQDYLFNLLHWGAAYDVGAWHNTNYDRLVDRADALSNGKERTTRYIEAQHIALSQGAIIMLMQQKGLALIKPYVHGLVGAEAYPYLVPKDLDWANVSIGNH